MKKLILTVLFLLLALPNWLGAFSDVPDSLSEAADYLQSRGIIEGYEDGTLRPERLVNRAEFVVMIERAFPLENTNDSCFSDVDPAEWYYDAVCAYGATEVVNGYADGLFQPEQQIKAAEALKVLLEAGGAEVGGNPVWYVPYYKWILEQEIAFDYDAAELMNRGQIVQLIADILPYLQDTNPDLEVVLPVAVVETAQVADQSSCGDSSLPEVVNFSALKNTWLNWINTERQARGLKPYNYNPLLEHTAIAWSEIAVERGAITHKREGQVAYYDYYRLLDWFEGLGVTFTRKNTTVTENIGWGIAKCDGNCQQNMEDAMRFIYDLYMAEEGAAYRPHFNSIVSTTYTDIGFGMAYSPNTNKVFMTTHVGVDVGGEAVCK